MLENQESWIMETTEQQEQSDELLQEEYDRENELFENTAQRILTQSKDIPDEIREKIEDLINEHNLETSIIQTFSGLYKIYWDNIDFTSAMGNQQVSEKNKGNRFEFLWKNSEEIINLLKSDNMIVMWTLASVKRNKEYINWETTYERESFLGQIYAIPSTLDKNNYEINEISFVDTLNDRKGENPNKHLLYSIVNKVNETASSTATWYNEIKTKNTTAWKEATETESFKEQGQIGTNYIIWNLRTEPVLDKKWKQEKSQNWEPLYNITFNIYTLKQNDKQ